MKRSKKLIYSLIISVSMVGSQLLYISAAQAEEIGDFPNLSNTAYTINNIFTNYGYKGQCTWFAYGRALEKLGVNLPKEFYGNAIEWWTDNLTDKVYNYGLEPKVDSIAVWSGGSEGNGHVGYVEKVEGDKVYLNEGNFSVKGNYEGKVEVLSKNDMKNRGNILLKGYIYIQEKYTGTDANTSTSISTNISTPNNSAVSTNATTSIDGEVLMSSKTSKLNVRSSVASSSNDNIVGSLLSGAKVEIVRTIADWYEIKFGSSSAYVSSKYIKLNTIVASDSTAVVVNLLQKDNLSSVKLGTVKLKDSSSKLNVRTKANGKIFDTLNNGDKVEILETDGDFYKIKHDVITGYVSSNYITLN